MKVLAVTGRLAQSLVSKFAPAADVLVLDTDIAAFITPEMLRKAAPKGYDLILIPGAITADFQEVEKELGTRIRLGPKHAADLGLVLKSLDEIELSRTVPACQLLENRMKSTALAALNRLEEKADFVLKIKGVKVGGSSRMKVLAEVVDSTKLSSNGLKEKIRYYQSQGADLIDLGLPLDARPEDIVFALRTAREATDLPLSIDTSRPELILAGVQEEVDMVLSLEGRNIPLIGKAVADAGMPAVVIPGPGSLEENIEDAVDLGIKAIADPVLGPPLQGLCSSIADYMQFHKIHPEMPLFFGAGNVTELLDADSQGMSAILAAIGAEVGASILFTPEYSPKACGSVSELRRASEMMALAKERGTPPKDLGLDLLVLKEKRRRFEENLPGNAVEANAGAERDMKMDPAGSFRVFLSGGKIIAQHEKAMVSGTSARDILNTIIEMNLVSGLDHAGYLGRELEKAEIALILRRSYIQDGPLLPDKR